MVEEYCDRHKLKSAGILTITDDEKAALVADHLRPRLEGKVVVEIGAGIGLLACHLSEFVKRIIAIEADPAWTSVYVAFFFARKPKNLTYIFGAADEVAGMVKADVAIFCTHSGHAAMRQAASLFAPEVIDVYGELGFASEWSREEPIPGFKPTACEPTGRTGKC